MQLNMSAQLCNLSFAVSHQVTEEITSYKYFGEFCLSPLTTSQTFIILPRVDISFNCLTKIMYKFQHPPQGRSQRRTHSAIL